MPWHIWQICSNIINITFHDHLIEFQYIHHTITALKAVLILCYGSETQQFISMFYNPYSVCIIMYDKFDKYESIKYRLDCIVPGSNQLIDQEISNHS